jgi:hypothetical protein
MDKKKFQDWLKARGFFSMTRKILAKRKVSYIRLPLFLPPFLSIKNKVTLTAENDSDSSYCAEVFLPNKAKHSNRHLPTTSTPPLFAAANKERKHQLPQPKNTIKIHG